MLPDLDPNDGSTVEHIVYGEGDNGVTVEHYKITGGDHSWPGSVFHVPGTNYDIDASIEIWNFFTRYDIGGLISVTGYDQLSTMENNFNIYPNPTNSFINIESNFTYPVEYELFSPTGKKVMNGILISKNQKINLLLLSPNVYFLKIENITNKILKSE